MLIEVGTFEDYLAALPDQRKEAVERLHQAEQIDGLILGGTELPLLLRGSTVAGVTFLDTTQLHVERIVAAMLAG